MTGTGLNVNDTTSDRLDTRVSFSGGGKNLSYSAGVPITSLAIAGLVAIAIVFVLYRN